MDERHLSKVQAALACAVDQDALLRLARESGFCERMRSVSPQQLVVALVAAMATQTTETIADIARTFNALTGHGMAYKPFHKKLAKPEFPEFMRRVVGHLLDELVSTALRPHSRSALSQFDDIVLHDGSSFSVNDALRHVFPGRYTAISPAAVEVHASMSLWCDQPICLAIAPDTEAERHYRPEPTELRKRLFIADRGYQDVDYCRDVDAQGGYVLIRHQTRINPVVLTCFIDGVSMPKSCGRRLQEVAKRHRRKTIDVDVQWEGVGRPNRPDTRLRVVLLWNPKRDDHMALVTNLDRVRFPPDTLMQLYRLRWQVELLFKEWKSYCNLHAFTTTKAPIAEGLMWASLAACIVKRFMAKSAQSVFGDVELSTRKVAMTVGHHLYALLDALLAAADVRCVLRRLLQHLHSQARRAHPKRDRRKGRLALGIAPVLA